MLTHFVYPSQYPRLIRSSLQTLADFSVCVLTHCSRRVTLNVPSIKPQSASVHLSTIQRSELSLKSSADTHPPEKETHTFRSLAGHPNNGSQDSTSATRYSHPIRNCEAHCTVTGQNHAEPLTGYSNSTQTRVGVPGLNGCRTLHRTLQSTTPFIIKTNFPFLSDELCENFIRIKKTPPSLKIKGYVSQSDTLRRKNLGPEPVCKTITPALHFDEVCENRIRIQKVVTESEIERVVTQSDTLKRKNLGPRVVDEKDRIRIKRVLPKLEIKRVDTQSDTLKRENSRPEVFYKTITPAFLSDAVCENRIRIEKIVTKTEIERVVTQSDTLKRKNLRPRVVHKKVEPLPLISMEVGDCIEKIQDHTRIQKQKVVLRSPIQSQRKPLLSKARMTFIDEDAEITKPKEALSQNDSLLKSPIRLIRKIFLWSPWKHSDSFYPSSNGEKELDVGKIQPIFDRSRVPDRGTSCCWRELHLRTFRYPDVDKPRTSLDGFSLAWSTRYAVIVRGIWSLKPWKDFSNLKWQRLITLDMDSKAILQAWSELPVEELDETWREFMLWALQHSHGRALMVLDVAISDGVPYISRYILRDCLDYLAVFYLKGVKSRDSLTFDRILRLIRKFIRESGFAARGASAIIDNRTLSRVANRCKKGQVQTLWDSLVKHDTRPRPWTLLHFLAKFVKMTDMSRSMVALRRVIQLSISKTSWDVQFGCANILRGRFDSESWFDGQTQLWNQLLQMGIPPSIDMYNAMIYNCVLADEYDTALTLYGKAWEENLRPNILTYDNLLQGLKRGWSFDVLDLVARDAEADGTLFESDYLVCRLLSASTRLDFPKLLQLYGRYYDPTPLYDFGFIKPGQFLLDPVTVSRPPSSVAVTIMLNAYINQNPISNEVVDLYDRYCALGREWNPHAIAMAGGDWVPNAFIRAFGRRSETVELCTSVIRAMLSPPPPPPLSIDTVEVKPPTIISWTLLVQAFCRHGQMIAAEKVMSMMRKRGVKPNPMTWSILIFGHAAAQDIDGAVGAVRRMEAHGFPVTDYIVAALGMYRDRNRMLEALNDATEGNFKTENEGFQ